MEIKQNDNYFSIPNLFTLGNLLCGCLAIVYAFEGFLYISSLLVIVASFFDFLDGFVARALKQSSAIGQQLDSLADMVTFGVVPSVIVYQLLSQAYYSGDGYIFGLNAGMFPKLGFLIALFSALRLAKFNIDTRQTKGFLGLPTPANAIFWIGLPLIDHYSVLGFAQPLADIILTPSFIVIALLILSFLLISEVKMFSLKVTNLSLKDNALVYSFMAVSLVLLISLSFLALPIIIALYIILSIISSTFFKKNTIK